MYDGQPFWSDNTNAPARFPALTSDTEVDVAVIGAGIAGLSTAWEVARTGRTVMVLEGRRIGSGVTGHTTAKVSALHGARYRHLSRQLGSAGARAYAHSQTLAIQHLTEIVESLAIDCDLERRPAYLFSEDEADVATLADEARAARNAGLSAHFTHATGLGFPIAAAVRLDDQLMFHPLRYLAALADDLVAQGATIHEQTRVSDLSEGGTLTVTTRDGHTVRARDVVVATHFPIFDRSLLFARLHPRREFVLAGPVPEESDPPGMYVSLGPETRSLRSTAYDDQRLLIATGAPFAPADAHASDRLADLRDWFTSRTDVDRISHSWAAQDNHTPDGVPFIGPLHPFTRGAWVTTGFGGWGISNGVLSGILIRDLIEGRSPDWADIYHTRRLKPAKEARSLLAGARRTVEGIAGSRVSAKLSHVTDTTELPPGQSARFTDSAGTWATYRDDDGLLHEVSATCTHIGCLVAFNEVERTWECPCHGSRFALDGSVIQGPATTPLQRRPNDQDSTR